MLHIIMLSEKMWCICILRENNRDSKKNLEMLKYFSSRCFVKISHINAFDKRCCVCAKVLKLNSNFSDFDEISWDVRKKK